MASMEEHIAGRRPTEMIWGAQWRYGILVVPRPVESCLLRIDDTPYMQRVPSAAPLSDLLAPAICGKTLASTTSIKHSTVLSLTFQHHATYVATSCSVSSLNKIRSARRLMASFPAMLEKDPGY